METEFFYQKNLLYVFAMPTATLLQKVPSMAALSTPYET